MSKRVIALTAALSVGAAAGAWADPPPATAPPAATTPPAATGPAATGDQASKDDKSRRQARKEKRHGSGQQPAPTEPPK